MEKKKKEGEEKKKIKEEMKNQDEQDGEAMMMEEIDKDWIDLRCVYMTGFCIVINRILYCNKLFVCLC